jgi:hypothetical protein
MQTQFETIQPWLNRVLAAIKKDIKSEHLPSNPPFYRTYFGNKPIHRLTSEEIFAAYAKELVQGNADLGDWVVNRWVFQHGELYEHFAERLSQINPEFSEIKALSEEESNQVLEGAVEAFGAMAVYLFSILNGVVFPKPVLDKLAETAKHEAEQEKMEAEKHQAEQSLVAEIERQKREIARLENRVSGVQKKYTNDIEALKKQIRALQQRLK